MKMRMLLIKFVLFCTLLYKIKCDDVLGCGGFAKSHVPIDFSKVVVKMFTKQGILKDQTNCAPNNGYYFFPVYDKGDYILKLEPPPGWSFTPTKISVAVDGVSDICSQGKDINFIFNGFGITGKVETLGGNGEGPANVTVTLKSDSEVRTTLTAVGGSFFFTPVYPGSYVVSIEHPRWKIAKKALKVAVAQGNTELPAGSLVLQGYDVSGFVYSEGEPVKDVTIVLLPQNPAERRTLASEYCDKSPLPDVDSNVLCHVLSNEKGVFTFPAVACGKYKIVPYYKDQRIHFQPPQIEFVVAHGTVTLPTAFLIMGFSISGKVLDSPNGNPVKGATVVVNNTHSVVTKSDGSYVLEKINAGYYSFHVDAENLQFEDKNLKVNPSMKKLPDFSPVAYSVCGTVLSDQTQTVKITDVEHAQVVTVPSKEGKFCTFLHPGKYELSVVPQNDQKLVFFPLVHSLDLKKEPVSNVIFSQLKATISGNVSCIRKIDCESLSVVLRPIVADQPLDTTETIIDVIDSKYKIEDIVPGTYELSINSRKLCFEKTKCVIAIYSLEINVPEFKQIGYQIRLISSHNTLLKYRYGDEKTVKSLALASGVVVHCLDRPGKYEFTLESCHTYEEPVFTFDTDVENTEIMLVAHSHLLKIGIASDKNYGPIAMSVKINDTESVHSLKYIGDGYTLQLYTTEKDDITLVPSSDVLYFIPSTKSLKGASDCRNLPDTFQGVKGRIFKGKIVPPLSGVLVSLETDKREPQTVETDNQGGYKFPPQDESKTYTLNAHKDSYVLTGPDQNGNFHAQKLAELHVQVIDEESNLPLHGTLLSLSGGESYRSNLQTNESGQITFHSLSPSQYYLRPMMKEYSFEPYSRIIDIKEGASSRLLLKGKRVAYSVFGEATTLNGEADYSVVVVAYGTGNCSELSEEAAVEAEGRFRIRGLLPACKYDIKVRGHPPENPIERSTPEKIGVENIKEDVHGLKFLVFRQVPYAEILFKVFCKDVDHYKTLRIVVSRESPTTGLIYTWQLDSQNYKLNKGDNYGVLVQVPSIQSDGKLYSVRLESSLPNSKSQTLYFVSNSTFNYFEFEFNMKLRSPDQQVKRTSMWTLVFIFLVVFAVSNTEYLYSLFKDSFAFAHVSTYFNAPKQKVSAVDISVDTADIDQIVQSINAVKRKNKPKKI